LQRELTIVVGVEKKMTLTAKGSVDRKVTLSAFEREIDQIYKSWSKL
jgi:hypothetical protein